MVVLFARYRLATSFASYDDEGYCLLSLSHYMRHGGLYISTYSQYGSFYFYAQDLLFHALHLSVTHDSGRFITLLYWVASALLAGGVVRKLSGSGLLGAAAVISFGLVGEVLANEPGHPQQIVLFLFTFASCLSLPLGYGVAVSTLALGAIGAALIFTKINIGVFYFAALAQTLVSLLPRGRSRALGMSLTLAYAIGAPLLLMHADLDRWASGYCLVAICCTTAVFICGSLLTSTPRLPSRYLLYPAAGVFLGGALIIANACVDGMSISTLVQGVLWQPLKQPRVFSLPLVINPWKSSAVLLTAVCIWAPWLFRRRAEARTHWLGALRFTFGIESVLLILWTPASIVWILPFLPVTLLPLRDETWRLPELLPRLFLVNLAATQFLQAYPVAGSQVSIGAMPLLLWAFTCIADGAEEMRGVLSEASTALIAVFPKYAISSTFIFVTALCMMFVSGFRFRAYTYPPSGLRGSNSFHLPPAQADRYRFLAGTINANCSVLFSLPGLGSFNFWADIPTPNGWNLTAWPRAFNAEKQKTILDIVKSNQRACVIYNKDLARLWGLDTAELLSSPLARYIILKMPTIAKRDGYEIRIHPTTKADLHL